VTFTSRVDRVADSGVIGVFEVSSTEEEIGSIAYQGFRGEFDVEVIQDDIPLEPISDILEVLETPDTKFQAVQEGSEIIESVEVVNDGDTILEYAFTAERGQSSSASIRNRNVEIRTGSGSVNPKSRKSVNISVTVQKHHCH
jgi:hypothetical protein